MTPIDPATPSSADPRPPMAPPYIDENLDLDLVERGLEVAEDEVREAVADNYETTARLSDDPEGELDDIDFAATDPSDAVAEVEAMHEEVEPSRVDAELD